MVGDRKPPFCHARSAVHMCADEPAPKVTYSRRNMESYSCKQIPSTTFFLIFLFYFFISFAIPKYNNYSNYNYYHKAYMHKLTTHLSTRAIPQLPHKVMPTVILQVLFKKEETNHFFSKEEKLPRLQSPFVH